MTEMSKWSESIDMAEYNIYLTELTELVKVDILIKLKQNMWKNVVTKNIPSCEILVSKYLKHVLFNNSMHQLNDL